MSTGRNSSQAGQREPEQPKLEQSAEVTKPVKAGAAPKVGDEVRVFDSTRGVDDAAIVERVQGPHPEGGHVIDVTLNSEQPERERRHSVRFLADENEARTAGDTAFPAPAEPGAGRSGGKDTDR